MKNFSAIDLYIAQRRLEKKPGKCVFGREDWKRSRESAFLEMETVKETGIVRFWKRRQEKKP
jgi:hypothetical protein